MVQVVGFVVAVGLAWLVWALGPFALYAVGILLSLGALASLVFAQSVLPEPMAVVLFGSGWIVVGLALILYELRVMSGRYAAPPKWQTKWLGAWPRDD